jgi:hypothetical protein
MSLKLIFETLTRPDVVDGIAMSVCGLASGYVVIDLAVPPYAQSDFVTNAVVGTAGALFGGMVSSICPPFAVALMATGTAAAWLRTKST